MAAISEKAILFPLGTRVDDSSETRLGFGEYAIPNGSSFEQINTASKTQKIAIACLMGGLTAASLLLIPVSLPLAILGALCFAAVCARAILSVAANRFQAPPTNALFPEKAVACLPRLGEVSAKPAAGFATRHGVESHFWKLELIRSARHSIVLSGCYCGGESFDETLDLIQDQMRIHPKLATSILSSEIFISKENEKRIENMEKEFGDRFTCTVIPEVFPYESPASTDSTDRSRFSYSSNHTKALVIDYGAYYMVGGSGIVQPWARRIGETEPDGKPENLLQAAMGVKAFRDMDFVFGSPQLKGAGTRLHVEMMKLIERFGCLNRAKTSPPFSDWPERMETKSIAFEEVCGDTQTCRLACYASGPEQEKVLFLEEMIRQVRQAKTSIEIDHLYFHPPQELLEALIDASNRGVKITLIINRFGSHNPASHALFAELSRYFAQRLFEGTSKPNVEVYEFATPKTTLHKKVVVFDKKTALVGSANIGKKSLEGLDYEINLKVESEEFAAEVSRSIEKDQLLSQKMDDPRISCKTEILASIQKIWSAYL